MTSRNLRITIAGALLFLLALTVGSQLWAVNEFGTPDRLSYNAYNTLTNPTTGTDILNVNTGTKGIAFHQLVVSATVATKFRVTATSAAGATCSSLTPTDVVIDRAGTSTATVNHTCTTDPTAVRALADVYVAANGSQILNLEGFGTTAKSSRGLTVTIIAGITGDAFVSIQYSEER